MGKYLTVLGESFGEYEEKRSKFIASLCRAETEDEALQFIEKIRSKYWDARHNCFAYSVDGGKYSRFSDDGEPHGTAGKPILDVITGNEINDAVIVVTRYFGGVLLGTGGLVRAYSSAAKDALSKAQKAVMVSCTVFETVCDYTDHQRLKTLIENLDGRVISTDFTDKVCVKYVLKDEVKDAFLSDLNESFSARVTAETIENKLLPYEIS